MKWKIILFMMVMLMLELVHAAPSISLDILSNDTYNTSNSIFNITLSGTECSGGNTSWWNSTGKQVVALYDFNINETDGNFLDLSGSDKNLTCTGTICPTFNQSCGIDGSGCYIFDDSNDRLVTGSAISDISKYHNFTIAFSIMLHEKINALSGCPNIFRNNIDNNNRIGMCFTNNTGELKVGIYDGAAYFTKKSSFNLNIGTWYHIVVRYDNTSVYLYVNNTIQTGVNQPGLGTGNYLAIVDSTGSANLSITDFKVYNYNMSAQEVSELYNSSIAKRSPRLLPEQTTNEDIWQGNVVCSNTTAYSTRASEILYISDCITLLANTSYSSWLNISSCDFYDHLSQSSNFTTYDANNCGTFSNITYNLTRNDSCNFCSENEDISVCFGEEDIKMTDVAITLSLIGFAFWLVYTASGFNTKTDKGETIYTNTLLKILCYSAAGFVAFVVVLLSYSLASYSGYSQGILDLLMTNQNLIMWFAVIVLFIIFFGVFGNAAVNIAKNIGTWVSGRRKR